MYRVVFVVALYGLLVQAVPSDQSLREDAGRQVDHRDYGSRYQQPVQKTQTSQLEAHSGSIWGWLVQSTDYLRNSFSDYFNRKSQGKEDYGLSPQFTELCDPRVSSGYHARRYDRSVWVSVSMQSRFSDVAVLVAQPRLEKYFYGANDRNLTINMTRPLRLKSPRPTGQYGPDYTNKTLVYSMYLPPELHDNPPQPTDTDLIIVDEKPTGYFVITFPSYTYAFLNFQKRNQLEDLLNTQRERFIREFDFVDVYNWRFEVTSRRNEVLLQFDPEVEEPNCAPVQVQQVVDPGVTAAVGDVPRPGFQELCKETKYEARLYSRALWASSTVHSVSSDVGRFDAYAKLDRYINGNNNQGMRINRTYPLRITQEWPKSVYNPEIFREYTYSYYLPPELYGNIPQPVDTDVLISDEPPVVMFALKFPRFTFDFRDKQYLQELQNLLTEANESYMSSMRWASNRYYRPSQVVNCENDILVYMDQRVKHPRCAGEFPPCKHRNKECPSYRVLQTLADNIDKRHISGNLYVLRRTNTCNMTKAYNDAYMPLHRYFRGANDRNETIQRVPPVVLVHKSRANPPEGCDFAYNLMFYMPAEKHPNPPVPTEAGVELFRVEAGNTFVITYEESSTEAVVDAKVAELRSQLDSRSLCYDTDEFSIASYDASFRPRPHRHEIWITEAKCTEQSSDGNPLYSIQGSGCDVGTECPTYETIRSYGTFSKRVYGQSVWLCKETRSCNVEQAFNDSITSLYDYYQTCYDVDPKSRPVISCLSLPDLRTPECNKVISTCAYLPEVGRLPLVTPPNDLSLVYIPSTDNPWHAAYVASLQGKPTMDRIRSSITSLLQGILDADLMHNNNVFVAHYTLPWEDGEPRTEVGVLTDTLNYNV